MNPKEKELLEAVVSRILPTEDRLAERAGVATYVETSLSGPIHGGSRPLIGQGLQLIEHVAQEDYERPFAECDAAEQDAVLEQVAEAEDRGVRHFFQTLVTLVLEGFLVDPSYGGNRNELGWRFMGVGDFEPRPADCVEEVEP